jgi:hypothetical protein
MYDASSWAVFYAVYRYIFRIFLHHRLKRNT